jgi:hypothetical protein
MLMMMMMMMMILCVCVCVREREREFVAFAIVDYLMCTFISVRQTGKADRQLKEHPFILRVTQRRLISAHCRQGSS